MDESLAIARREDDTTLWHRRLGHMNQKNLTLLVRIGLLDKKKISVL